MTKSLNDSHPTGGICIAAIYVFKKDYTAVLAAE